LIGNRFANTNFDRAIIAGRTSSAINLVEECIEIGIASYLIDHNSYKKMDDILPFQLFRIINVKKVINVGNLLIALALIVPSFILKAHEEQYVEGDINNLTRKERINMSTISFAFLIFYSWRKHE
jgi:hypothetical protein